MKRPVVIREDGKSNVQLVPGMVVEVYEHTAREWVNINFAEPVGWTPKAEAKV